MAALSSLVKAGRTPSEILVEIDRVLRMGRSARLFTSVALLRLDPATGSGLLANAGHPFPILLHEGKTTEITGSGLPLGQGPKRTYADVPVEIPRGGVLVIASDGLFEGPDRFDAPYGFDRPRTVLEVDEPLAPAARLHRRGASRGLAPARGRGPALRRHDDPRREEAAVLKYGGCVVSFRRPLRRVRTPTPPVPSHMSPVRRPPLEGVVVLDLSRVLAGPVATMVLADLGARVVKVEDPRGGDFSRGWKPPDARRRGGLLPVGESAKGIGRRGSRDGGGRRVRAALGDEGGRSRRELPSGRAREAWDRSRVAPRAESAPRRLLDLGRGRRRARKPASRGSTSSRRAPRASCGSRGRRTEVLTRWASRSSTFSPAGPP